MNVSEWMAALAALYVLVPAAVVLAAIVGWRLRRRK